MEEGGSPLSDQSLAVYAPLLQAILEDDWIAAQAFIHNNRNCLGAAITKDKGTALHFAAAAKRTRLVKILATLMSPEQLELTTNQNLTALYFAAQSGIVTIAELMVKKNANLPLKFPVDKIEALPLYAAIKTGNRNMVSYLYSVTPIEDLAFMDRIELLQHLLSQLVCFLSYIIVSGLIYSAQHSTLRISFCGHRIGFSSKEAS